MTAERFPVLSGVMKENRRALFFWSLAVGAVSAMYISFYPVMADVGIASMMEDLPEALVKALGYERVDTPAGWLTSTVFGLLAPVLSLVFAISHGAGLIAGQEENGTLELDLVAPVPRRRLLAERLVFLWLAVIILVIVVTLVTLLMVTVLNIEIGVDKVLAGSTGLLLLVMGFGTVALATGAATGRKGLALGVAGGLAVLAFMLNSIGQAIDAGWMTAVSPFSWYLEGEPLFTGFDARGLALLAIVPVVSAVVALGAFERRDLMV